MGGRGSSLGGAGMLTTALRGDGIGRSRDIAEPPIDEAKALGDLKNNK